MAVRYDALLARALAKELHERFASEPAAAIGLQRAAWTSAIVFSGGHVLYSFLHPRAGQTVVRADSPIHAVLEDRSAWRKALKAGSIRADGWNWILFRDLRLTAIEAVPDERVILFDLSGPDGDARFRMVMELPRNRRNVILLETSAGSTHRGQSILRPRPGRAVGAHDYRMPVGRRAGVVSPLDHAEWEQLLSENGTGESTGGEPDGRRERLLRGVAYASPLNADYILRDRDEQRSYARYLEILDGREAWLLARDWGQQPYVHRLGDEAAVSLSTITEGMALSAREEGVAAPARGPDPASAAAQRIAQALRRRQKRLRRRIAGLESELADGESPERLREAGHLLLAHLKQVRRGESSVVLTDFEGEPRAIPLDPALGPADNADRFYRTAARRERALARLPGLIAEARATLERIEAGLARLSETGEADPELTELAALSTDRPASGESSAGRRIPYRRYVTTGGLEVRVGRSSRENDDLTFRNSSPNDIWLHARQAPGAHVILRWTDAEQNPPERDLLEAAILAAQHSDARTSGVVAVDWTRRKYVRKPRKAGPGAVTAERLRTLFVEPDAEATARMSPKP